MLAVLGVDMRPNCIDWLRIRGAHWSAKVIRLITTMLLLVFTLPAVTMATYGAGGTDALTVEYQLKAAFLYNFAKFVEWPAEANGGSSDSFILCISGDEPFRIIRQYLAGKKVRGQVVAVRAVDSATGVSGCHLLFVSVTGAPSQHMLSRTNGAVLTVGESEDFIRSGGIINLVRADNRLRFEIARNAGERAGLKFSSQLLKLAAPVDESQRGS